MLSFFPIWQLATRAWPSAALSDSGEKETDAILKTPTHKEKNSLHVLHEAPDDVPVTHIDPRDLRGSLPDLAKRPPSSIAMASAEEVHEEYSAALAKLTANVRPLIMNLTELANEYKRPHARMIAKLIDERIRTVGRGLQSLSLHFFFSTAIFESLPWLADAL